MAGASYSQNSFLGGEWSQYAQGRFDEQAYKTALNVCFNAIPLEQGGWTRRPGSMFAGFSRRGAQGRLIGFQVVASAPLDLEFTPGYLRIWNGQNLVYDTAGVTITNISTANPCVITVASQTWQTGDTIVPIITPDTNYLLAAYLQNRQLVVTRLTATTYSLADQFGNTIDGSKFSLGSSVAKANHVLEISTGPWSTVQQINTIRIAQSESQVLIFAVGLATQLLVTGSWALSAAGFTDGPYLDPATDGSTIQSSGTSGSVTLTASAAIFTSAMVGRSIRLLSEPPAWFAQSWANGSNVKWNGVYYTAITSNISSGTKSPDIAIYEWAIDPTGAQWAYAVITAFTDSTHVTATLHNIPPPPGPRPIIPPVGPLLYTHDSTDPISTYQLGLYWGTTYPTNGAFHEGRWWFAGAVTNRVDAGVVLNGLVCSPTYFDGTVADDSALALVFDFPEVIPVYAMTPMHNGIVCHSQTGEVLVQSSNLSDPITPTSAQAHLVTRYGSQNIEPLLVGYSVLMVQRYGKKVLDLTSDVFSGRYGATNVSVMAQHLTNPGIFEIRFQREQSPILWATVPNGNGNLIGMSYKRENFYSAQGPLFMGWHRHQMGGGRYPESITIGTSLDGATDTLAFMSNQSNNAFSDYNIRHVEFLAQIFQETQSLACAWQLDDAIIPTAANVIYTGGVPTSVKLYGFWHGIGRLITAYIGGLDCGDYTVASDGSITVPFAPTNTFQPLFTFAFLEGFVSSCNSLQFIGGASYTAPVFLTHPAIQSYVNTESGQNIAEWSGAFGPGTTTIFGTGPSAAQQWLSQFNFLTGALVNQQQLSAMASPPSPPQFQSSIVLGPDGKLYWTKSLNVSQEALYKVDPSATPYVLDASATTTDVDQEVENHAYLTMGSTHWLVAGSFSAANVGYSVCVFRVDAPSGFGFWGHAYNDGTVIAGNTDVCAGPQSSSSATAYWTQKPFSIYGTTYTLGKTVISAGADSYNPATWPTTNPNIASSVLKSYIGTDFDAGWTASAAGITYMSGPAYDQTDGNVIVQVSGTPGGNAHYIAKLSTTDGHVIWKTPIGSAVGFDPEAMTLSRIQAGTYYYWDGSTCTAFETATGSTVTQAYSVTLSITSQVSDDALGCIMGNCTWSGSGLTLLNSTASSGATMGTVYFANGQQPLSEVVATASCMIGYTYNSDGQLLRIQDPERSGARNGPSLGKKRRNHQAALQFGVAVNGSVAVGSNFPPKYTWNFLQPGDVPYPVTTLFQGVWWDTVDDDYSFDGMLAWRIGRPYPLTVTAVEGFIKTQDK